MCSDEGRELPYWLVTVSHDGEVTGVYKLGDPILNVSGTVMPLGWRRLTHFGSETFVGDARFEFQVQLQAETLHLAAVRGLSAWRASTERGALTRYTKRWDASV
jgi:hypothetical protein